MRRIFVSLLAVFSSIPLRVFVSSFSVSSPWSVSVLQQQRTSSTSSSPSSAQEVLQSQVIRQLPRLRQHPPRHANVEEGEPEPRPRLAVLVVRRVVSFFRRVLSRDNKKTRAAFVLAVAVQWFQLTGVASTSTTTVNGDASFCLLASSTTTAAGSRVTTGSTTLASLRPSSWNAATTTTTTTMEKNVDTTPKSLDIEKFEDSMMDISSADTDNDEAVELASAATTTTTIQFPQRTKTIVEQDKDRKVFSLITGVGAGTALGSIGLKIVKAGNQRKDNKKQQQEEEALAVEAAALAAERQDDPFLFPPPPLALEEETPTKDSKPKKLPTEAAVKLALDRVVQDEQKTITNTNNANTKSIVVDPHHHPKDATYLESLAADNKPNQGYLDHLGASASSGTATNNARSYLESLDHHDDNDNKKEKSTPGTTAYLEELSSSTTSKRTINEGNIDTAANMRVIVEESLYGQVMLAQEEDKALEEIANPTNLLEEEDVVEEVELSSTSKLNDDNIYEQDSIVLEDPLNGQVLAQDDDEEEDEAAAVEEEKILVAELELLPQTPPPSVVNVVAEDDDEVVEVVVELGTTSKQNDDTNEQDSIVLETPLNEQVLAQDEGQDEAEAAVVEEMKLVAKLEMLPQTAPPSVVTVVADKEEEDTKEGATILPSWLRFPNRKRELGTVATTDKGEDEEEEEHKATPAAEHVTTMERVESRPRTIRSTSAINKVATEDKEEEAKTAPAAELVTTMERVESRLRTISSTITNKVAYASPAPKKKKQVSATTTTKMSEAQLAAKYAAIEDLGERAYQILLDLGMVGSNSYDDDDDE